MHYGLFLRHTFAPSSTSFGRNVEACHNHNYLSPPLPVSRLSRHLLLPCSRLPCASIGSTSYPSLAILPTFSDGSSSSSSHRQAIPIHPSPRHLSFMLFSTHLFSQTYMSFQLFSLFIFRHYLASSISSSRYDLDAHHFKTFAVLTLSSRVTLLSSSYTIYS